MIAEAGLAALWLAAAMALLQTFAGFGGLGDRLAQLTASLRGFAVAQGLLSLTAFAMLLWLFARTDLSVGLVALNSHIDKPMLYKIAGAWGNHEGSMLLWVTVLSLTGGLIALLERKLDARSFAATLGAQGVIALGFYAFLLFSSNPFARLSPPAPTGQGLNPLLQDPGLAFHPPTLYIGYVGLSVAFSFAVGAMLTGKAGPAFARAMRPWVLISWIFLTLGITAGSYWAYYELGWGGWWFWDPVENASLMPWLAATALLHSVSVLAARDALRAWTIMLALTAFAMSMIGTFLVRSGILTSVHAFAVDPERGTFILVLLALYIGGALVLFGTRIGSVRQGAPFHLFSREGGLVANNILLSAILAIVLIGTLYPLIAEGLFGEQLSVGPPYFDKTTVPVALVLMLFLAAGPLLRWRRDGSGSLPRKLVLPAGASVVALILLLVLAPGTGILPLLGLVFAAGLAVASIVPLWGRKLLRTPLPIWGMVLAHLGVAVAVVGMASESGFTQERLAAVRYGEELEVGGWKVQLLGLDPVAGPNWTAIEARVLAKKGDGRWILHPQSRSYSSPVMQTNEAALLSRWNGQLYATLGAQDEQGRWQLRLWWKPFVSLIWLGGVLIALGGALALIGRVWRGFRARFPKTQQEGFA
ncbi:heme lyase CcmF/NrfE family subunit [Novosphingopyxis iocasae]|uniref:heme lyase CcmF/NrfE family subunit n=1 Tax=Novosphingopyxis iocasae TaxID=2762729 RepID=UPI0016513636|nr:heme lyase CcmF/NrfE family subunit [Novosphingopyxis iocasae]